MSNIASSTYPVRTSTKSGDLFVIVRNGQLQKVNRAGLEAYIKELSPGTVLSLTDAPNSYVGQQGKALVVNTAENAMEFIDNFLVKLGDTPSSYTGASEKILRVNTGATGVEFVTSTAAAPAGNLTGGWFDINHSGTVQNYTTTGTFVKVLNDAAGPDTRSDFAPPGVTTVYDPVNSQFDLSQLSIGDWVTLRIDMTLETTAANEEVGLNFVLDAGGSEIILSATRNAFKTAGTGKKLTPEVTFYIGSATVRDNPAEIRFRADATANLSLVGYAVFVKRLGAL